MSEGTPLSPVDNGPLARLQQLKLEYSLREMPKADADKLAAKIKNENERINQMEEIDRSEENDNFGEDDLPLGFKKVSLTTSHNKNDSIKKKNK